MKTSIISIPASTASGVVKSLHVNGIDCKYMGLDQSGRLLMEISYTDSQNQLIADLTDYMADIETMGNEIAKAINEFQEARRKFAVRDFEEFKKQFHDKQKAKRV